MKQGEHLFSKYEVELKKPDISSIELFIEEKAADLVLISPMVSQHIYASGLVPKGKQVKFRPIYSANLSMQYSGIDEGKGALFNTNNAHRRASVLFEHAMKNYSSIREMIKSSGKSGYDFYYALRAISLVESIQCDYIAGVGLSQQAESSAGIALVSRFVHQTPDFREFLLALDVDYKDRSAVLEFLRQTDARNVIIDYWQNDKYFQRRSGMFVPKGEVHEAQSDNATVLWKAKSPELKENLIANAVARLELNIDKIKARAEEYKRRNIA